MFNRTTKMTTGQTNLTRKGQRRVYLIVLSEGPILISLNAFFVAQTPPTKMKKGRPQKGSEISLKSLFMMSRKPVCPRNSAFVNHSTVPWDSAEGMPATKVKAVMIQ